MEKKTLKYIIDLDDQWHKMNEEMPPTSTQVELLTWDRIIVEGEIVVEMSGYYIYLNPGWGSLDDYSHWRFR